MSDPPNPKPTRIAELVFWKMMMINVAPSRPSPTVNMPATPPVRNATLSAAGREPDLAAAAVRTLPRVARVIPMKPVRADRNAPATNANVRNVPDCTFVNATTPSGWTTFVDVRNTIAATGIMMTAIVLNWRRRYAAAPTWIARAISIIFGVPWSAASTPRIRWNPTAIASTAASTDRNSTVISPPPSTNCW